MHAYAFSCCNGADCRTTAADTTTATAVDARRATYRPRVDIAETPNAFIVRLDVPGVTAENVAVEIDADGVMTVNATTPDRGPANGEYLRRDYGVGDYSRSFEIGETIDASGVTAEVANGVLTLTLPKAAASTARKINVVSR